MPRIGDDQPEPVDLGALTRAVRMALLITDAALPLDHVEDSLDASAKDQIRDRSRLRGLAFSHVLRELTRYQCVIRPSDVEALMDRRVPEPEWPQGDPS